jgi:cysteinyl-tRNA synthetase
MSLRVYDVMRRKVVRFEPRDPGRVSMYVCGPTVYGPIHIGNARTILWFDMIRRYLGYRGFEVTYVMNYTDVDDKIIERARVEGTSPDVVAAKYSAAFERDMTALGAEPADLVVKATDHIGDMIAAVSGLIDAGLAYEADGDVYYAVEKFDGYGKLSGRTLEEMRAGERVEPMSSKRHPLDFALWKAAKEDEPAWDSPWGPGRPGWHIECSVMSTKYLGMGFDIHGGASDLTFPHHENEIAQAEGLTGRQPFVRHWLHAGLVQMESEKMSKSIGNIVLAHDVAERFGEATRYWALMGSYRTQMVFSDDSLADAAQAYERWRTFLESARHALGGAMPDVPVSPLRAGDPVQARGPGGIYLARFVEAMDDDFNSAAAFAAIHDLVREGNRLIEPSQRGNESAVEELAGFVSVFLELTGLLNFSFAQPGSSNELVGGLIDYLLELRQEARAKKAFDRADGIRARLASLGVQVEDTPAGPRWRIGSPGVTES